MGQGGLAPGAQPQAGAASPAPGGTGESRPALPQPSSRAHPRGHQHVSAPRAETAGTVQGFQAGHGRKRAPSLKAFRSCAACFACASSLACMRFGVPRRDGIAGAVGGARCACSPLGPPPPGAHLIRELRRGSLAIRGSNTSMIEPTVPAPGSQASATGVWSPRATSRPAHRPILSCGPQPSPRSQQAQDWVGFAKLRVTVSFGVPENVGRGWRWIGGPELRGRPGSGPAGLPAASGK